MTSTWRYWRINGKTFYSPTLAFAFDLARRRFGNADLVCTGGTLKP
jgi:hypothetical protein